MMPRRRRDRRPRAASRNRSASTASHAPDEDKENTPPVTSRTRSARGSHQTSLRATAQRRGQVRRPLREQHRNPDFDFEIGEAADGVCRVRSTDDAIEIQLAEGTKQADAVMFDTEIVIYEEGDQTGLAPKFGELTIEDPWEVWRDDGEADTKTNHLPETSEVLTGDVSQRDASVKGISYVEALAVRRRGRRSGGGAMGRGSPLRMEIDFDG